MILQKLDLNKFFIWYGIYLIELNNKWKLRALNFPGGHAELMIRVSSWHSVIWLLSPPLSTIVRNDIILSSDNVLLDWNMNEIVTSREKREDTGKGKYYFCEHSEKKFTRKSNLKRHINYFHLNATTSKCEVCPKDFFIVIVRTWEPY